MSRSFHNFILLFFTFGALFIPLNLTIFPFQKNITEFLFTDAVEGLAQLFNIELIDSGFNSDSARLWLLIFVLSIFAAIISLFLYFSKQSLSKVTPFIYSFLTFYLALITFKYGIDKLFHLQFYLPDPNTLATPIGQLDQDIAFWSIMGSSKPYNQFMGWAEILPSLLILFQPSRKIGLFILTGIYVNIVAINWSFDISVKLLSGFLLLLTILLLFATLKQKIPKVSDHHSTFGNRILIKIALILLLLIEGIAPVLINKRGEDSYSNWPYGAYAVESTLQNNQTMELTPKSIKRIFIHRNDYLIFQTYDDDFVDYPITLLDSTFEITLPNDSGDQGKIVRSNEQISIYFKEFIFYCRQLDWKKSPVLERKFHLTIDRIE